MLVFWYRKVLNVSNTPKLFFLSIVNKGNNLYDDELVAELKRVADKPMERSQYILMERIRPPVIGNYIVRPDSLEPIALESASELGIHGFILRLVLEVITREVITESEWQDNIRYKQNNWFLLAKKVRKRFIFASICLLYTSPSPRDSWASRMPSSAWKKKK